MTNREAIQILMELYQTVVTDDLTTTIRAENRNEALDKAVNALRHEPILCKDCEFYYDTGTSNEHFMYCFVTHNRVREDDYCSGAIMRNTVEEEDEED